jgi:hypothetical protein
MKIQELEARKQLLSDDEIEEQEESQGEGLVVEK